MSIPFGPIRVLTAYTYRSMIRTAMLSVPAVDVFALARRGGSWQRTMAGSAFSRLAQEAEVADVEVDLQFALDDDGRPHATGMCRFVATVCCRRCLRDEPVEVASCIDFRVVASDVELQALMPEVDAVVSDGPMPIAELIEDDLLMSLPEIACKERETCPYAPTTSVSDNAADRDDEDRQLPFEALASLKDALAGH